MGGAFSALGVNPDPAAGVAILLSPRMADRLLDSGCVGTRVVYGLVAGPVCNMFVMVVYIPHRGRKRAPFAQDTIARDRKLLATVCKTDCIILMGDLNCELQRNIQVLEESPHGEMGQRPPRLDPDAIEPPARCC